MSCSFIEGPSRRLRGASSPASATFLGGACAGRLAAVGFFAGTGSGLGWAGAGGSAVSTGPTATTPPHCLHLALSAANVSGSLYWAPQSPQMPLRNFMGVPRGGEG